MNCEQTRRELALYLYGELPSELEAAVDGHLDGCASCRTERDQLRETLRMVDRTALHPDHRLLTANRNRLRARVASEGAPVSSGVRMWNWLAAPSPLLRAAFSMALLGAGYLGGQWQAQRERPAAPDPTARVRFVEPRDSGRVQIVVEETSRRTVSGGMDEEPIRRLVLAAAQESQDPGVREETVGLLVDRSHSVEVRRALLRVLQNDHNSGVRLRAIDGLRGSAGDPETRRALAKVVLNDNDPGVRAQVIDLLIQKREALTIGVLQELVAREEDEAVRARCQRALRDMKASEEVF